MARARVRASTSRSDFTNSELEMVIREAPLGIEDTRIAEMYLLNLIPQVEIGAELGLSRSAISKRLPCIIDKIERTAKRLNMI